MMTFAAALVSPGGLGDGAWVKDWRNEMCAALSASISARSLLASILRRSREIVGKSCKS